MKGFTKDHKFIPMSDYKKVTRKSRDQSTKTEGVRFKKLTGKPKPTGSFMIGAGGLRPIFTGIIPLEVGGSYYLGGSADPKHVIITKLTNDTITYRAYPYGEDFRVERNAGEDLIRTGLTNRLKVIQNSSFEGFKEDIKNITLLLASDDDGIKKLNFQDFQPVSVEVDLVKQPKDRDEDEKWWRHAESFGGAGGISFTDSSGKRVEGDERTKGYSIHTSRGKLDEIKNDPLYKNFKITEDQFKGK